MHPYKGIPVKFVSKMWGWESWIVNKDEYCGKLLFFKKGMKCSFHYHQKDETFYVQDGRLKVWYSFDDELPTETDCVLYDNHYDPLEKGIVVLEKGDTFHVKPPMRHRMMGLEDTLVYEFSTTHVDSDIVRIIKSEN
jgi:quercetin dioxygenase-like cupin family protein